MKRVLAIAMGTLLAGSMSASADIIIAGWDAFNSGTAPTATVFAAGVTGTAAGSSLSNGGAEDRGSSSDTTWGSFDGNGDAASSVIVGTGVNLTALNGVATADLTLTLVNNGAVDLDLANFHMDALAFRPTAPRTYALNVLAGSDITVGNVFTSASQAITSLGTAPNAAQDQHDEIDLDLTGLADSTLEVGGTAIIQIAFSGGGGGGGHHLWIDNIAVSGTVVPEPSTLGLMAFVGGLLLMRRRRS